MSTDVLSNNFQFSVHIENSRSVNSAGSSEIALRLSQFFWERKQCVHVDPNICRFDRGKILPYRIDACLPADSATARNRAETSPFVQLDFRTRDKIDADNVVEASRDFGDLSALTNNRFGNQKTGGKLIVMPRRAHGCGQSFAANSNFQRLFDRQLVAQILE